MICNEIIYSHLSNSLPKFQYSLLQKFPFLQHEAVNMMDIYYLYFLEESFSVYFYIELIKYLDAKKCSFDSINSIMKHAALTQLYDHNLLCFRVENEYTGYLRNGNKIIYFKTDDIEKIHIDYQCLKVFMCNEEKD